MNKKNNLQSMVLIAIMAAVICVMAPFSIPIGPVPISLTNFAIYIIVYILGWKRGTLSYLLYLAIGLIGVPVFSGFSGGFGKLFGPTGGYLFGFIFICIISGLFVEKSKHKIVLSLLGMVLSTAICYVFGTAWLAYQAHLSFSAALAAGVIPFIPGDIIKMVIAVLVGPQIAKQLKKVQK